MVKKGGNLDNMRIKNMKRRLKFFVMALSLMLLGGNLLPSQVQAYTIQQSDSFSGIPKVQRSDIVFKESLRWSDIVPEITNVGENYVVKMKNEAYTLVGDCYTAGSTNCSVQPSQSTFNVFLRKADLPNYRTTGEIIDIPGSIVKLRYNNVAVDLDGNDLDFVVAFDDLRIGANPAREDVDSSWHPNWHLIDAGWGGTVNIQNLPEVDYEKSRLDAYVEHLRQLPEGGDPYAPEAVNAPVNTSYRTQMTVTFNFYKAGTNEKVASNTVAFGFTDLDQVRTTRRLNWEWPSSHALIREGVTIRSGITDDGKIYTTKKLVTDSSSPDFNKGGFRLNTLDDGTQPNATLQASFWHYATEEGFPNIPPEISRGQQGDDCSGEDNCAGWDDNNTGSYDTGFATVFKAGSDASFIWRGGSPLGTNLFRIFGSMLSIDKSVDNTEVKSGDIVEYTIKITHTGDPVTDSVVIDDDVNSDLKIISTPEGCQVNGQKIHCEFSAATINDAHGEFIRKFKAQVRTWKEKTIPNTASIKVGDYDNCNVNRQVISEGTKTLKCSDSVDIHVTPKDIPVDKEVSDPEVMPGSKFNYTITNQIPGIANGGYESYRVCDKLPNKVNYDNNMKVTLAGQTLTANTDYKVTQGDSNCSFYVELQPSVLSTLTTNKELKITFRAKAAADVNVGVDLENNTRTFVNDGETEWAEATNTTVEVTPGKTVSDSLVPKGAMFTYDIEYNEIPGLTNGYDSIKIYDEMPANVEYKDGLKVILNDTILAEGTDYEVTKTGTLEEGYKLEIALSSAKAKSIHNKSSLHISFIAQTTKDNQVGEALVNNTYGMFNDYTTPEADATNEVIDTNVTKTTDHAIVNPGGLASYNVEFPVPGVSHGYDTISLVDNLPEHVSLVNESIVVMLGGEQVPAKDLAINLAQDGRSFTVKISGDTAKNVTEDTTVFMVFQGLVSKDAPDKQELVNTVEGFLNDTSIGKDEASVIVKKKNNPTKDVKDSIDGKSINNGEIAVGQRAWYSLTTDEQVVASTSPAKTWYVVDDIDENYDRLTGQVKVKAEMGLGDKIKAGDDISSMFNVSYTNQSGENANNSMGAAAVKVEAKPELLDLMNSLVKVDTENNDSETPVKTAAFKWTAYVEIQRVKAGNNISNKFQEFFNDSALTSNEVHTNTPELPAPQAPAAGLLARSFVAVSAILALGYAAFQLSSGKMALPIIKK